MADDDDIQQAVDAWAKGGRESLRQRLAKLGTDSGPSVVEAYKVLQALLPAAYPAVPPTELATLLADAVDSSAGTAGDLGAVLANSLYTLDTTLDERLAHAPAGSAAKQRAEQDRQAWTAFCRALWATGRALQEGSLDRFDYGFLERLGLSRSSADVLTRRNTRALTVKFYSLRKFNLLRESSEGYSLLLVLLHSEENLGPGKDPATGWDIEPADVRARRARSLWEKLKSVIGFFELDPNRTLDVILDAFLPHLLTHHRFFLALLACSPWAAPSPPTSPAAADAPEAEEDLADERGRAVVAQILGFKFRFYQGQDVMRDGKTTPNEMYLLAALLVREGIVRLRDLWPHLSPEEAEVDRLEAKWRSAVNEKARSSRGNAMLAAAAALDDDEAVPVGGISSSKNSSGSDDKSTVAPAPLPPLPLPDQKLPLIHALLVVGAHGQAAHLLGRLPHLVNADPAIADLVLRQLEVLLRPLFDTAQAADDGPLQPPKGLSRVGRGLPTPAPKLTLVAPTPVATRTTQFVGFCPEWSEGLTPISSLEELFISGPVADTSALGLLRLLGAQLSRRKDVLVRLVRLGRAAVADDPDSKSRWNELLRLSFLPSLSLSGGCCSTSQEIWALLSLFSVETRYGIYGFWRAQYATSLQLKVQSAATERDAKSVLRRVSKDDIKLHARALGKLSHADPLVLWAVVLRQIQSYENLVKPVVESARYITPLGADTIVFMLLDAFSNPDKDRTKTDGTSTSLWLKALAAFAGELCRRHASLIDCRPILHYVANQLRAGNPKDLVILRELVSAMTAIDPLANLSDNQVAAMGGGTILRAEAIHPTVPTVKVPPVPGAPVPVQMMTVEKRGPTGRSAAKLAQSLRDDGLVLPMLVAVAQARETCISTVSEEEAHMKHLSSLFDNSTEVLFQFVDFLLQHMPAEEYAALVPSLSDLADRFGLSPSVAFHILRPKLSFEVRKVDAEKARETSRAKEARLKQEMMDRKRAAASTSAANAEDAAVTQTGSDAAAESVTALATMPLSPAPTSPVPGAKSLTTPVTQESGKYHPSLKPVILSALKVMAPLSKTMLGAPFFVSFWQLAPYDLEVPIKAYQREIDRLERANSDIGRFPAAAQTDQWRREREQLQAKSQALVKERDAQMEAYAVSKRRLNIESAVWFRKATDSKTLHAQIFQHCIFPRALLSLADASFSARFLRLMHSLGTTNFASMWFYNDFVFTEWIAPLVASFTENEARNYARFMHDCLEDMSSWRMDEAKFRKEAHGEDKLLPGFRFNRVHNLKDKQPPLTKDNLLPWAGFRKVAHKWSSRFVTALELCLASGEYMHIKNVVILLQKILPCFPREKGQGAQVEGLIKSAIAQEKREDLKLLLQSYSSQLGKLKPQWLPLEKLMAVKAAASSPTPVPPSSSASSVASKPADAASVAKPEAMDVDVPAASASAPAPKAAAVPASANGSVSDSKAPTPLPSANGAGTPAKPNAVNLEAETLRARLQASTSGAASGLVAPKAAERATAAEGDGGRSQTEPSKSSEGLRLNGSAQPFAPSADAANGRVPDSRPISPVRGSNRDRDGRTHAVPTRPSMSTNPSSSSVNGVKGGLPARPGQGGPSSSQQHSLPSAPSRQASSTYGDRRPASPPPLTASRPPRRSPSPARGPLRRSPSPDARRRRAGSVESTRSRNSTSAKDRDGRYIETDQERADRKARERDEESRHRRGDDRDDRSRPSRGERRARDRDGRDGRDRNSERDLRGKERDPRDIRDDRSGRHLSPARDLRGPRDDRDRDRDPRDAKRARRDDDPRSNLASGANSSTRRSPSPVNSMHRDTRRDRDAAPHMAPPPRGPLLDRSAPPPSMVRGRDRTPPRAADRERALTPPASNRGGPPPSRPEPPRMEPSRGGLASRMGIVTPAAATPPPPTGPASSFAPAAPATSASAAETSDSKKRSASQRDDDTPPAPQRRIIRREGRDGRYGAINAHLGGSSRR